MTNKGKEPQKLASSNWLALQKKLKPNKSNDSINSSYPHKKRKTYHEKISSEAVSAPIASSFPRGSEQPRASTSNAADLPDVVKNGESLKALRKMIAGDVSYSEAQKQPGKYLAMDCEMVGVGLDGKESSLARVSIVNYYGAVQMDEFVRQKERVVDYRTEWSGIRPSDMISAKPFEEVQKQVADLLKDRILVGHAIHNDTKALLLSHPRSLIRDTQTLARKHKLTKSNRPALRHLVQQEVGVAIQGGEHSSVVDARATMAVYRLHRKEWEKGFPPLPASTTPASSAKRKRAALEDTEGDDDDEEDDGGDPKVTEIANASVKKRPGQRRTPDVNASSRKGVSSGLSTIIKRKESKTKTSWWKDLGGGPKSSFKP